ncbi:MAG: RNA polymerase sigma-70 factor (ECF subfamily) [Polaribacter sp.]|jgi:RNA polymerase sigma-70 factor (ECF subfamily)
MVNEKYLNMYLNKTMMYSQNSHSSSSFSNTIANSIEQTSSFKYEETILDLSIEQFLKQVEAKAFRMAEIATKNQADALDIVQDAMIKLVEKYSDKPSNEWKPLFYRILQSKTMDYFRKKAVQNKVLFWRKNQSDDHRFIDEIDNASNHITLERELDGRSDLKNVSRALKNLAPRQQQCFMLRSWEGFSVRETAIAMKCSEGSVKTHYSRAKEALRKALGDL